MSNTRMKGEFIKSHETNLNSDTISVATYCTIKSDKEASSV